MTTLDNSQPEHTATWTIFIKVGPGLILKLPISRNFDYIQRTLTMLRQAIHTLRLSWTVRTLILPCLYIRKSMPRHRTKASPAPQMRFRACPPNTGNQAHISRFQPLKVASSQFDATQSGFEQPTPYPYRNQLTTALQSITIHPTTTASAWPSDVGSHALHILSTKVKSSPFDDDTQSGFEQPTSYPWPQSVDQSLSLYI